MISSSELTQAIKQEAYRLGFHLAGVTTPEPPPHLDIYEEWLSAGHYGEMAWLASDRARQRRADPRLILPECQAIIVLGVLYPPSPSPAALPLSLPILGERGGWGEGEGEGSVASYAWGQDYHDALPPFLRALVEYIEQKIGHAIPNRWYTDSGPVLERELAQRAGLGWIGKNTNLINPKKGSFFLIAEILMGIELVPDAPFTHDRCGSCTRCIEACPTGCILPNRTIAAHRCISYLTIELKGSIPPELRPRMGNWIFGCDICQQVCPWNKRFALPPPAPPFTGWSSYPSPGTLSSSPFTRGSEGGRGAARPSLAEELSLSPEAFNCKFEGSPIKRAKRRGYLRNVAVALGNSRNADAIPALTKALSDDEPLVREHAAWALEQIVHSQ
ncbi:MAG: tRNA epoxyqueuosine(34) reductase QueG [Chloroflexi bacterium]|nr:tRNA epoxyqueuosine(34) reductase QueG [Chloroflexota bacterium]